MPAPMPKIARVVGSGTAAEEVLRINCVLEASPKMLPKSKFIEPEISPECTPPKLNVPPWAAEISAIADALSVTETIPPLEIVTDP